MADFNKVQIKKKIKLNANLTDGSDLETFFVIKKNI